MESAKKCMRLTVEADFVALTNSRKGDDRTAIDQAIIRIWKMDREVKSLPVGKIKSEGNRSGTTSSKTVNEPTSPIGTMAEENRVAVEYLRFNSSKFFAAAPNQGSITPLKIRVTEIPAKKTNRDTP